MISGVLFYSRQVNRVVLTAYWAFVERDSDESRGAILIFDRQSLRCRYRIKPWNDDIWDDETGRRDEMEERIWEHVTDVGRHLIGLVTEQTTRCSPETKANTAYAATP
jgi:hypothetical protein